MIHRRAILRVQLMATTLFLALLFFGGCEKNTTAPLENNLELSPAVTEGLTSSWQTVHSLNSVEKISAVVRKNGDVEKIEEGGITSKSQLRKEISKMKLSVSQAARVTGLAKTTLSDSLIWFIDWTDPVSGLSIRKALYYNDSTGLARYYEAIYHFPAQLQLQYDSTEIVADLNFTLSDTTDDRFISLVKLTRFREGFQVDSIAGRAEATDYGAGNEITGAIFYNTVWYSQQIQLVKRYQELEINPDESGRVEERLDYRDGTYMTKTVHFYPDYTGDFSELWRDGTRVSGTFDRLEDDNHASFSQTIQLPAGRAISKIEQFADVTLNPADSSSELIFSEKIHFADGKLDTSRVEAQEYWENGLKNTHLEIWKSDGSHADLLVIEHDNYKEISGNYTGPKGYYMTIQATDYNDGSGELWVKIYQSEEAFTNGEAPLVSIYLHYNPDGSGAGKVTEGENEYNVHIAQDGTMTVTDQAGNVRQISGF